MTADSDKEMIEEQMLDLLKRLPERPTLRMRCLIAFLEGYLGLDHNLVNEFMGEPK